MKSFAKLHVLLAVTLALSLTGKVASNQPVPLPDQQFFASQLEEVLRMAGLEPYDRSAFGGGFAISAKSGSCEVWASEYTPYGTMADVISERASSVGQIQYVYKGAVSDKIPGIAPLVSFYWWRELARIGIEVPRSPIIAMAFSRNCDLSKVPWQTLRF